MKMEVDAGWMQQQDKECLGPLEAGGGEEGSSPRASGICAALWTPCFFLPLDLSSLRLKPLRLESGVPERGKEASFAGSPSTRAGAPHTHAHALMTEVGTIS